MNEQPQPPSYAIGACFNCRQLYLMTPTQRDCPLCLGAPKLWAAFSGAQAPGATLSELEILPAPPAEQEYAEEVACPYCGAALTVTLTAEGMQLALAPGAEEEIAGAPPAGEEYVSRKSMAEEPPSDPGLATETQKLDVAVEELAEKVHGAEAEAPPAAEVEREPATDNEIP